MPRHKAQINLSLDPAVLREFEKVAEAVHLNRNAFAIAIISRFAELKHEYGLHALASIPKDLFKVRPGRPPTAAGRTDPHQPELVGHVA